ncbi:Spanin inner membrane subunit [Dissostichus eleginoides]|uniref:Spanin inner membrane subunit n=1 Tax=Dissostichus eleginoides TaxID=100907 RepID=A0AAD9F308_DISEL|nr:Spanin inner membrane subunit [Dissostichus eleginoides]
MRHLEPTLTNVPRMLTTFPLRLPAHRRSLNSGKKSRGSLRGKTSSQLSRRIMCRTISRRTSRNSPDVLHGFRLVDGPERESFTLKWAQLYPFFVG